MKKFIIFILLSVSACGLPTTQQAPPALPTAAAASDRPLQPGRGPDPPSPVPRPAAAPKRSQSLPA